MPEAPSATAPASPPPLDYPGPRSRGPRAAARWTALLWPALALIALLAYNFVFTPGFFDVGYRDGRLVGSLIDVLDRAAPVAVVAFGMTLVIATGGIDLSVGAVVAIAGSVAAVLLQGGAPVAVAIAVALAACAACGAVNGLLVAAAGVQPIVATLILMVAGRGVAQMVGQNVPIRSDAFNFLGNGARFAMPFSVTLAAAVLIALAVLARATALGLFVESVGNNPTAARYAGVAARPVVFAVYVVSGLCAGIAGLVLAGDIGRADANKAGLFLELDAILAVVVGGTALVGGRFSLVGSALGALLMQALTTTILTTKLAGRGIPPDAALVVKAAVVLGVCLLQSPDFRARLTRRRAAA